MSSQVPKSVLMIIAPRDFRDEEFLEPREILASAGVDITVASTTTDKATGMFGAEVTPTVTVGEVEPDDYDAVLFIGGSGSAVFFEDQEAHRVARQTVEQGKILGAICIAPATLARAGVLEGRKATCFSSVSGQLKEGGAEFSGAMVQRDGSILTATGPEAADEFGRGVLAMLGEQ